MIANVEDSSLTPLFLLCLAFGESIAYKIFIAILYLGGSLGMYYLTKKVFKFTTAGALFSILVFVFNHFFCISIYGGDLKQLHYLLYPLLLALFLKSRQNNRPLYLCSIIFTFMLFQADFVALIFLLFLFLYIIPLSLGKSDFRYFLNFFKLIGLSLLIGAIKILPLINLLARNSRVISSYDIAASQAIGFRPLINSLAGIGSSWNISYFTGLTPIILAVCGLIIYWKQLKAFFLPLFIITWITLGPHAPWDLWRVFRYLPFFHSQKDLDQYYPIVIVMIIAIAAGKLFSLAYAGRKRSGLAKTFFTLILIFYSLIRFAVASDNASVFTHKAIEKPRNPEAFSQAKVFLYADFSQESDYARDFVGYLQYFLLKHNIGTINWKASLLLPENTIPKYFILPDHFFLCHGTGYSKILNPFYKGEISALKDSSTTEIIFFSPLKLIIKAQVQNADTIVINQNYNKSWYPDKGVIQPYKGLLALGLNSPGEHIITLRYIPVDFYAGLVISVLAVTIVLSRYFKTSPPVPKNKESPDNRQTGPEEENIQNVYLIVLIGSIALAAQIFTPLVHPHELINRTTAAKKANDREFLRQAHPVRPEEVFIPRQPLVGEYAVYKITGITVDEAENTYRYKISVTGKENLDGNDHFWIEHTLYDGNGGKRAVFKTLRPAITEKEILADPLKVFTKGLLPGNAKRLIMRLADYPETEISPEKISQAVSVLDSESYPGSLKEQTAGLKIMAKDATLNLAGKALECKHLMLEMTAENRDYRFSLWYTDKIPFLGIAKMDLVSFDTDPDYNRYPGQIVLTDYGLEKNSSAE